MYQEVDIGSGRNSKGCQGLTTAYTHQMVPVSYPEVTADLEAFIRLGQLEAVKSLCQTTYPI